MDIKELGVDQLKALAYDQLVNIERSQATLKAIGEELARRESEKKTADEVLK